MRGNVDGEMERWKVYLLLHAARFQGAARLHDALNAAK